MHQMKEAFLVDIALIEKLSFIVLAANIIIFSLFVPTFSLHAIILATFLLQLCNYRFLKKFAFLSPLYFLLKIVYIIMFHKFSCL
jgi:hypothetical protein